MYTESDLPPLLRERARYYAGFHSAPSESETRALREEVRQLHAGALARGSAPRLPPRQLMHAELLAVREYLRGVEVSEPYFAASISPEDVREAKFESVRLQSGYREQDVDDFLDVVEARVKAGQPPMPPTKVEFRTTKWPRVGYDIGEVDRFIERLRRA